MRRNRIKYLSFIPLIFLLSLSYNAAAAPAYGTDTPKKGRITMGYQANLVFKHKLSDSHGSVESAQHFLDLSYGVFDWFTFDGKLGVGNTTQKGGGIEKVSYDTSFAGGYGFRALLLDNAKYKTRVVWGFHHISIHPRDTNLSGNKYESFLDDWQIDLLGSRRFGPVNPYLGIKASKFDFVYRVNHGDRNRRDPLYYGGVITGCNVKLRDDVSLNVEGRFIDETALNTGIYYSF